MRGSLLFAFFLFISVMFAQQAPRYSRVRVMTNTEAGDMKRLAALGLPVDHGEVVPGTSVTTDLSESEIATARTSGFPCEVLIDDVQAFYRERNSGATKATHREDRDLCNEPPVYPTPQHFEYGSMGGFYTWQEMLDILDAMRAAYPDLISVKQSIGQSIEGRDIFMVRMSNTPDVDADRPEVLYDALHHSREPAGLSQLIYFMWYLLENHGTDDEVSYLLDNMELYMVPCLNPDGYVYNETISPEGGGMWRKNRRDNGDGSFGVDINRNYGEGWGFDDIGSSTDPASETYRGTAPFSEPETQAMRGFCNAHSFRLALNYHTYGNHLVYPWGYLPSIYTPDSAVFVAHGVQFAQDNRYHFGTANQTVGYQVNGGSDDWMYGEQSTKPKIFAVTPECGGSGDGFWPPEWRIKEIAQENMRQNLRLAHLAGVFAKAYDRTDPILPSLDSYIRFDVRRLGIGSGPLSITLEPLANVVNVGTALDLPNMGLLEVHSDSIEITLDPGMQPGDVFSYVVAVSNGPYTYRDTLSKVYGPVTVLLNDPCNNYDHWSGSLTWAPTGSTSISGASFTDSPDGNYEPSTSVSLVSQLLPLYDVTTARLQFWAKWEIESRFDHARITASQVSPPAFVPLCGRYTRSGTPQQGEGVPIYDGQMPDWVLEEINLDAYAGSQVVLMFVLESDDGLEYDGFYFDDLKLITTTDGVATVTELGESAWTLSVMPNPASGTTWLQVNASTGSDQLWIEIIDVLGARVRTIPISSGLTRIELNTEGLVEGVYQCRVMSKLGIVDTKKFVVVK